VNEPPAATRGVRPGPTDGALVRRLAALDSCAVSDALDTLGLGGAVIGIRPLWPLGRVVAGRARTVQAGPPLPGTASSHIASALVDDADPGDVVVIANGGRLDVSCWGGILAYAAQSRGVAAVVIDGACRDIAESEELDLPVLGRAVVPVSARGRIVQQSMDQPVQIGEVSVTSGDLVIADSCGVVVVAGATAERVVRLAERIAERERAMVAAIGAGGSTAEVMHDTRFPTAGEV
jgi:regulator of RNase E activity RraA